MKSIFYTILIILFSAPAYSHDKTPKPIIPKIKILTNTDSNDDFNLEIQNKIYLSPEESIEPFGENIDIDIDQDEIEHEPIVIFKYKFNF
jgi:hypothetical protein